MGSKLLSDVCYLAQVTPSGEYLRGEALKASCGFYRAACNADAVLWWEFCLSVCLSVRLSVCHTRELWQNGRKICPDLYTIRKNI